MGPNKMSPKAPLPRDQIIKVAFWRSVKMMAVAIVLALVVVLGLGFIRSFFAEPQVVVTEDATVDLSGLLSPMDEPNPTPANFADITKAAGIDFVHNNGAFGERLLPETMGGGVAFFDFNNNGHQDLLFINSSEWAFLEDRQPSQAVVLYQNNGQGQFQDVTEAVGLAGLDAYGMGVAVGDYDGDGWVDLFITTVGENRLFQNDAGVFVETTQTAGVAGPQNAWSTSAAFFDANQDGYLDLYVANYVVWSREIDIEVDYRLTGIGRAYGPPSNFQGTQPELYINQGDGTFVEVAEQAGLHIKHPTTGFGVGKGLAVAPVDINHDGRMDLVVANDTTRNFVYLNQTDTNQKDSETGSSGGVIGVRFEEVGTEIGMGFDRNGMATGAMGIDFAHYNNDDSLAIAIGNFANEMSSFYVSQGQRAQFNDQSIGVGIGGPTRLALTFGVLFFDYDLDGRLDYLQANGHVENDINRVQASQRYRQPAQLFWNCGRACERPFSQVPEGQMGGLATPIVGRGAAYADIDQDGRMDVVLTQVAGPPVLLKNQTQTDHQWIGLVLEGLAPNKQAIGAKVTLKSGSEIMTRHVMPTRSYLSQVALPLHFGLGVSALIDEIVITWPDGGEQVLSDLALNQYHTIIDSRQAAGP